VPVSAAYGGHLAVLTWLRANDCPWDEDVCAYAASNGHLVGRCMLTLSKTRCKRLELSVSRLKYDDPLSDFAFKFTCAATTWRCCVGRGSTAARGAQIPARSLPTAGTLRPCGGLESRTARGMRPRPRTPLGEVRP